MTTTILADSVNPAGSRLTTFQVELPKYVLAQLAKHRALSMNFESSRAKPFWRVLEQVIHDPYVPTRFGKATAGMQPAGYFEDREHDRLTRFWRDSSRSAAYSALEVGYPDSDKFNEAAGRLHIAISSGKTLEWFKNNPPQIAKETLNRILEPYMKVSGVVSGTEWQNFIDLRTDPSAQDDINILAKEIQHLLDTNEPNLVVWGQYHKPALGDSNEEVIENIARVSYGNMRAASKRIIGELYDTLAEGKHWSPFEHVAYASHLQVGRSNFDPSWVQVRQMEEGN